MNKKMTIERKRELMERTFARMFECFKLDLGEVVELSVDILPHDISDEAFAPKLDSLIAALMKED